MPVHHYLCDLQEATSFEPPFPVCDLVSLHVGLQCLHGAHKGWTLKLLLSSALSFCGKNPGSDRLYPTVTTPPCSHLLVYLTPSPNATVCTIILEHGGLPLFAANPAGLYFTSPCSLHLCHSLAPPPPATLTCRVCFTLASSVVLSTPGFGGSSRPHRLWSIKPSAFSFQAGLLGTLL